MDSVRPSHLRYVDAGDIEDSRVDFDGLDVYNAGGDKLGDVDGFIIDLDSNRPYYVVVDSGGWFSSQRYLVPIGHARLDTDNDRLRIDIGREAIERFPAFEAERFEQMPEDEARRYNETILQACCPTELKGRHAEGRWDYDAWSHYRVPEWWQSRPVGSATGSAGTTDHLTSRPTSEARSVRAGDPAGRPAPPAQRARERVVASERAQPGDVIGVEHEGETTKLGDTARDESERRRDAEEAARKNRE
jgi:hypothetical protein